MADETTIIKGAIEDHLGRVLHPETEGDQVVMENGKLLPTALQDIINKFNDYLPLTGGSLSGILWVGGKRIFTAPWGCISCADDGTVVIANNAYKHSSNLTYHFMATHNSMGAKGIVMQMGKPGIWYFDTGSIATVANAEFTPTLISLTDKSTKEFTGNLNSISENTIIDCTGLANGPGEGWYFIQHISHSADPINWATQIAYALNSNDVKRRRKNGGVWFDWEPFMTASNTPTQYYSTVAPTAADGKDGDVWDVYV